MHGTSKRLTTVAVAAIVGVPLVALVRADGATPVRPHTADSVRTVAVTPFVPRADTPDPEAAAVRRMPTRADWPVAARATVDVPAPSGRTASRSVTIGRLPIRIAPAAPGSGETPRCQLSLSGS